jgi:TRAP-type C4-dicarboxylate transport system substrate-binding protein
MRRFAWLLCAAAVAWLQPSPVPAAEQTLRFATINAKNTATYDDILVPFARAIEEKSGGRLAVDIQPQGGFGRPVELFPMVERGDIEIASSVQGYHPGRFPRSTVMELPLIYDTAETGTRMMWGLFEEGLFGNEYDSVKVLALYMLPPYGIFTTADAKVETLKDMRGLRIRAPGVTVGLALARMGTIPIGLPINLIGQTLNDKMIDGISYGWDTAYTTIGFGKKTLAQQVKYLVDVNFAAPALFVVMNKKVYEALAPELRKVIDDLAGKNLSLPSARLRDEAEVKAKEILAKSPDHQVIKLNDAERKELSDRVKPVIDEWVAGMKRQGIDGDKLLQRARALAAHS